MKGEVLTVENHKNYLIVSEGARNGSLNGNGCETLSYSQRPYLRGSMLD